MQNHSLRFKSRSILSFSLRVCAFAFLPLVIFGLCSCGVVEYFKRERPPSDAELYESYNEIELGVSGSGEVLAVIHDPEYELLSQSKSVIATFGQKKKGYRSWFNIVAFDENKLTAKRKYFFIVDEKAKGLPYVNKRRLRFESKMVIESEVLDEPYVDQNARQIAILRQVVANFHRDVDEVKADNKKLDVCRMLINQTLETVLRELDESPMLASKLSSAEGVDFDHITLGKGSISMSVDEDIVDVKVRVGSSLGGFGDPFSIDR